MSEKRFKYGETDLFEWVEDNDKMISTKECVNKLNELEKENEQYRNELTFLNKVISFFADNPMTKYSSKSELLEEMKLLEKMGLI